MTGFPSFDDFLDGLRRAHARRRRLYDILGIAVLPPRTTFDAETEALLDKTVAALHRAQVRSGKGHPPSPASVASIRIK